MSPGRPLPDPSGKEKKAHEQAARRGRVRLTWWISWNETSQDYRPLSDPPSAAVLAWWCSGEAGDGSFSTIVAWVVAPTEEAAKAAIVKDWPGKARTWRFATQCEPEFNPGDRFPIEPGSWSERRLKALRGGK